MKIKTSELIGDALDWVVMGLIFKGYEDMNNPIKPWVKERHDAGETCGSPSTNRDIGYEILETEGVYLFKRCNEHFKPADFWDASLPYDYRNQMRRVVSGPTPLIAICRCFVASKKGVVVEIPDELCIPPTH